MNQERLLKVLLAQHISEKTAQSSEGYPQYVFKVLRDSTKVEIKKAVEQFFKVQVKKVCVCNMKARSARFGKTIGQHKAWKKAYVILEKGQEIEELSIAQN